MEEAVPDWKDQRRQRIVATARAAFFKTGYGGTTMSAICASLGGSKTTLWSYFPNKQELFSAVVDDLVEQYGQALRIPLPDDEAERRVLTDLAESLMTTIFQPEIIALHRLVTGEAARFPELGQLLYERAPRRGHERIAKWIANKMAAGVFRDADPVVAAQHFSGLCQSGAFQRHLIGARARPSAPEIRIEVETAVDAFLRAYAN